MFLRRSIAFAIAALLLVSNTGFALTVHYCGGRISSVKSHFIQSGTSPKDCCGSKAETHRKCCSDKTITVKGKSPDSIAKIHLFDFAPAIFLRLDENSCAYSGLPAGQAQQPAFHCDCHAPPLFKLHCQFVFYA
jgi:hypothetical protein